ncbi:MAG: ATP-dependent DNA ligase [Candidatus Rokuibacteriota bacterium]|nr:MAG: ATP-dependent DNA ligase [Candidatus Rokubacteria bacterium]
MADFRHLVTLCLELERTPARLEKLRLVAGFLRALPAEDVATAVLFLTGRAFPPADPRALGIRWLPSADEPTAGPPLSFADVAAAFAAIAETQGQGARQSKERLVGQLLARASQAEREILARVVSGEMRTGVSDGLVLEAIAQVAAAPVGAVRRAALRLGDLSTVAGLGVTGGAAALAAATARPGVPLLPMLAEIAADVGEALAAHRGRSALEFKYDGARIQLHRDGDGVAVWTRRLSDVTRSLPDVVAIARRDLGHAPFILDGEVLALDPAGRPLPFQELMRRFRRVHGVDALVREMPLALYFFDCLMADGRSLIDEPYERRWEALAGVTGGRHLAERVVVADVEAGRAFFARALEAGHEGVMAKDLESPYEPGGRGKRWLKLKAVETLDCVIVAADRGSGRRRGWLSNYHLAVRDGGGFADVGKTFKGLTDAQFAEMTSRLWGLATADDGYTVRVRPEVVVEVAYNEIQKSPTYRSGLALRFARITKIRDDKGPTQTTTLAELSTLYERQFATKGRAV